MATEVYGLLPPHLVISAVEGAFDIRLDGMMTAYPSYVNRVYGVRAEEGAGYVVKFYRPDRWSEEAILEEHRFIAACAEAELPVVPPLPDGEGETLQTVVSVEEDREQEFFFTLYPKRSGRIFDAEGDEEWLRLGSLLGRLHAVGRQEKAVHRLQCTPDASTRGFIRELNDAGVVHPDQRAEFFEQLEETVMLIDPLFRGVPLQRIHGDCHRGNILERPGEGLLLIDFDDMMMGPRVQDFWLFLPDQARSSRRELELILEGYEQFSPFDRGTLRLIEPLRFMRMVYFLAWCARQREDLRFRESFPDWGSGAFWSRETEDFRTQLSVIRDELEE